MGIIFRSALPVLALRAFGLVICVLFPDIILWLPGQVYGELPGRCARVPLTPVAAPAGAAGPSLRAGQRRFRSGRNPGSLPRWRLTAPNSAPHRRSPPYCKRGTARQVPVRTGCAYSVTWPATAYSLLWGTDAGRAGKAAY